MNKTVSSVFLALSLIFTGCGESSNGLNSHFSDEVSDETAADINNSAEWCVGKWSGQIQTKMNEQFKFRIKDDGTCTVKMKWHWGGLRTAEFEAEWEEVANDMIKIFDYDGHTEDWSNTLGGRDSNYCSRWSIYLRKDGALINTTGSQSVLGYINKQ